MATSGLSYDNRSSLSASPSGTGRLSMIFPRYYRLTTRKMVTIRKGVESFPIFFSSSIALLSSLLSCNFNLLDLKTISSVDILEMTLKDGIVVI